MRPKEISSQDGRNKLPLEAKVRALKLLKIDGFKPEDVLQDLENTFGIKITAYNRKHPKHFFEQVQMNIIELLALEGNVKRSRVVKLLRQAGLLGSIEVGGEQV